MGMAGVALPAALGSSLVACTPALNWRVVQDPDGFWRALFPQKPVEFSREISLPTGQRLALTLWAVRMDLLQLSVGVAQPTGGQRWRPEDYPALISALRQARVATIGASTSVAATGIQQDRPSEPNFLSGVADAQVPPALGGRRFDRLLATGRIPTDPQGGTAAARLWAEHRPFPQRIVEALAIGPDTAEVRAVAEEFLAGFAAGG